MTDGPKRLLQWRRRQAFVSLVLLFVLMILASGASQDRLDRPVAFPVTLFVAFVHVFSLTWWLFAGLFCMAAIAAGKGWLDRFLRVVTITAWAWTLLVGLGYWALTRAPHPSDSVSQNSCAARGVESA